MTRRRWAYLGLGAQFLALVRILAEYFRLRHGLGPALTFRMVDPFIGGALLDAALLGASVGFALAGRYRVTVALAVVTVAALLVIRFTWLPEMPS